MLSQIYSASPAPEGNNFVLSKSVTCEIMDWRDDKNGTPYPPKFPKLSVYMACEYKTQEELDADTDGTAAAEQESAIINFSSDQVSYMVSKDIGGDYAINFIANLVVNDSGPCFDEADDEFYD